MERELLAAWMMRQGFATGHGDTAEALLDELSWQVAEIKAHRDELLEALENLLKVHEGEGGTQYHAEDIARAAIEKAKGSQNCP